MNETAAFYYDSPTKRPLNRSSLQSAPSFVGVSSFKIFRFKLFKNKCRRRKNRAVWRQIYSDSWCRSWTAKNNEKPGFRQDAYRVSYPCQYPAPETNVADPRLFHSPNRFWRRFGMLRTVNCPHRRYCQHPDRKKRPEIHPVFCEITVMRESGIPTSTASTSMQLSRNN